MIRSRLQEFMTHPVFISLILWAAVILLIPPLFPNYKVRHIKDEYTAQNNKVFFDDLDFDNQSEKLSLDYNDAGQTKIIVSRNDKILDQYNLKYQPASGNFLYVGDYNQDGYHECYVFTRSTDSIFLNIIDPVLCRKTLVTNRFIDFRRKALSSVDEPHLVSVKMIEGANKKHLDLIFIINTGYSKQPRNVYRYLVAEDSLIKSPESAVPPTGCIVSDINSDSLPELILDVRATGNYKEDFPFSDQYSWLMVLDNNLKFLFPPVMFRKYPSRIMVLPLKLKNKSGLVVFHDYFGTEKIHSSFYLFDSKGIKLFEQPIEDFESVYSYILINEDENKHTFYFLKNRSTEINELDSSFQVINKITIPEIDLGEPLVHLDANLDGKKEFLFQGMGNKSLIITQNNFKNPVSCQYKKDSGIPFITQVLKTESKPMLYLQFNDYGSYIQFYRNPVYYFKYPFYGVLYFAVLFFITIIARIQQYRLNLKQQTEKKIASLQMKAIRNQIDPHFALNILNAIGSLYATENDREKADYIFGKYAKLIRQTVISSDQIIVTMSEELDFVRNYIDLERFRCNKSFDYIIDIDKDVDIQTKIPRMLIHTFVENSIKYGIRNKPEGGYLKIALRIKDKTCQIIIEDNGPGLDSQTESSKGTGKGLMILNELIELYYKLEKVKITYTLQNISGSGNDVAGTRAIIKLLH